MKEYRVIPQSKHWANKNKLTPLESNHKYGPMGHKMRKVTILLCSNYTQTGSHCVIHIRQRYNLTIVLHTWL